MSESMSSSQGQGLRQGWVVMVSSIYALTSSWGVLRLFSWISPLLALCEVLSTHEGYPYSRKVS